MLGSEGFRLQPSARQWFCSHVRACPKPPRAVIVPAQDNCTRKVRKALRLILLGSSVEAQLAAQAEAQSQASCKICELCLQA